MHPHRPHALRPLAALGLALLGSGLVACAGPGGSADPASPYGPSERVVLAIHGGAGTITRDSMTEALEAEYRAALEGALRAGHATLAGGGSAVDAVVAAIRPLEESPLFNAGVGAVFTAEGRCELDASIMDGRDRNAGAVAGVTTVRSPILAARAVMERSEHVLLAGPGAEAFTREQGLEQVDNAFFRTERRREALRRAQEREAADAPAPDEKRGTVGCVALDGAGHLAAGTSTGGMTNKRFGRVGDSPVVGAGTWAEDGVVAVSATGWGEYFLRCAVASRIAARMRFGGQPVREAAEAVVLEEVPALGGDGGVIALDAAGRLSTPFCTEGMYRGWVTADGAVTVEIYR